MRDDLSRRQTTAIVALIQSRTIRDAAKAVGVGEATLFRWLQDERFQDAYLEAKCQMVEQAVSNVQRVGGEAVDTLRQIMNDSGSPASSRVTAARVILEISIRAFEIQHVMRWLDGLEDMIQRRF